MNVLILIGIVLVSLIVLVLLVAIFVKKDYSVLREITINRSKNDVFDFIKYLRNQDQYSVWVKMDPNIKREYSGTDGTAGFVSTWDSDNKKVGKGEQEIKKIIDGERIELKLHFIKPFEGLADAYMTTETAENDQARVKWGVDSRMAYPMNIMLLVMDMDKLIGKDLETGLANLKEMLEKY